MTHRRYCLLTLACLAIVLWPAVAGAQVASPTDQAARSDCGRSGRNSSPPLADSDEVLKRLVDCGYELSGRNEYVDARRVFELAIAMARRRADRRSLAAALNGYGGALFTLGEVDRAEPLLVESVRLSDEIGDKDGMAEASSYLGRLRTIQARYADARVYHLRSLELWTAIDDRRGIAVALNNIGNASRALGDYVTALDYFQRSLDALERLGDSRRSATVIDNMGLIARRLGDYGRGLELAQRALKIREGFEDRAGIAKSLDSLSEVYEAQGNYGAALAALTRSLELRRSLGLAHATAESLNNIAVIYQAQGSYQQAVKYLQQSLALNQAKVGSRSLVAEIRTHLGELFLLQGQFTRAAQSLTRSLAISEVGGFKLQAADARYVLARVYIATRQFSAAQATLNACLAFRDEAGDRRGRADVLIEMAELDRRRGRFQEGLDRATEAGQLASQMELPDVQWRALALIGRLQLERSRPAEARDAFDAAIALIEGMRSQNPGPDESRSRFFADRLAPYRERIALALAQSDTAGAFSFAERSKARLLLDVLRGDGTAVTKAMSGEERGEELARRASLSSANAELVLAARTVPPDEGRLSDLKDKRLARRLDYEEFQARLYAAHPELRAIRAAAPVIDVGGAQALLPGPTAAIVEFVAARDRTYAFVITVSGVRAITLNGTTAALGRQVRRFRDQLEQRDARATETARALYDLVIGPMRGMLEGTTDLIVAPDGVLWDLPFQALQSRARRYLIEDMAVSYAPSITVLREMMRLPGAAKAPRTLLAFGNPAPDGDEALPDAEDEVRRVAETYGASSRVYVGAEAREDRWKAEAPAYRVVHIATHGVLDNSSPLYSHLLLSRPERDNKEDGLLEAWEIMNVPLRADLVVLSACETARGRIAPGEGILGLMWAVFVAGSPATLVSQWRVDSPSTTKLMVAFHREWNANGAVLSKARALQAASIAVLHSPGRSAPFYWAGFILAGDGR